MEYINLVECFFYFSPFYIIYFESFGSRICPQPSRLVLKAGKTKQINSIHEITRRMPALSNVNKCL